MAILKIQPRRSRLRSKSRSDLFRHGLGILLTSKITNYDGLNFFDRPTIDRLTDHPTDRPTDKAGYRSSLPELKVIDYEIKKVLRITWNFAWKLTIALEFRKFTSFDFSKKVWPATPTFMFWGNWQMNIASEWLKLFLFVSTLMK